MIEKYLQKKVVLIKIQDMEQYQQYMDMKGSILGTEEWLDQD